MYLRLSSLSLLFVAGCATAPEVQPASPLAEPKEEPIAAPEVPVVRVEEEFRFEKVGQRIETSNGVSVELLHARLGKIGDWSGAPTIADIGLIYSLPGHPTQVTSGAGYFYAFGRPVEVEMKPIIHSDNWDSGRGAVQGATGSDFELWVRFARSQPVPETDLLNEVSRAVGDARADGLEIEGYSWHANPMIQGRTTVMFKTAGDEAGLSTVNLVTGRSTLTRFRKRAVGQSLEPRPTTIEPWRTMSIESTAELPVAVRARASSIRQCLQASLVPAAIEVEARDGSVSVTSSEDALDRGALRCVESVVRELKPAVDFEMTVAFDVDFDTARRIDGTKPSGRAKLLEVDTSPSEAVGIGPLLEAYQPALDQCVVEAKWNEVVTAGQLTVDAKLASSGELRSSIHVIHDDERLVAMVPCLKRVWGAIPLPPEATNVRATYRIAP